MQHPLMRPSLAPYGFALYDQNRLKFKPHQHWVNAEREMAKFWEKRHRINASRPLPIETIVHNIMPAQAQANRLLIPDFYFRDLPYLSRDIALLSSIMYWFGTNVGSCFLREKQSSSGPAEREFLEKYHREMRNRDMVAFWAHQCTARCNLKGPWAPFVSPHAYDSRQVIARDRQVVEGLMRWLGRREGRAFIADWLDHIQRKEVAARSRRLPRIAA